MVEVAQPLGEGAVPRLRALLARNLAGERIGLTSLCTAHPEAVAAGVEAARDARQTALVEATCNQVNQEGGYTGLTPAAFAGRVRDAARAAGLAPGALVLGGDHLGPQPWRDRPAEEAMARACTMVRAYAEAGFAKLHLDASMPCAGDPSPLPEATVAARAARLAAAAEAAGARPLYVVGTEVPAPGGMGGGHALDITRPEAVAATWEAHREAFAALPDAWARVAAVVVQPGLDFGNEAVVDFDPEAARPLSEAARVLGVAFEAHSTDFQRPAAYPALVRGHFAILKVGPAATFALREALYALEAAEAELVAAGARSGLRAALEAAMLAEPRHWASHYAERAPLLRHFALSDRIRYYWTVPAVAAAARRLADNLRGVEIPLPLLGQLLPREAELVADGVLSPGHDALLRAHVRRALAPYLTASDPHGDA